MRLRHRETPPAVGASVLIRVIDALVFATIVVAIVLVVWWVLDK